MCVFVWCILGSTNFVGMSSAQDPFYIVKEEIQDSVSVCLYLDRHVFVRTLINVVARECFFVRLISCNLHSTNGSVSLQEWGIKSTSPRSFLLIVAALSGR